MCTWFKQANGAFALPVLANRSVQQMYAYPLAALLASLLGALLGAGLAGLRLARLLGVPVGRVALLALVRGRAALGVAIVDVGLLVCHRWTTSGDVVTGDLARCR